MGKLMNKCVMITIAIIVFLSSSFRKAKKISLDFFE